MSTIHPLQSIGIVHCPFFTSHGDSVFQVLYMFKSPTVKTEEPKESYSQKSYGKSHCLLDESLDGSHIICNRWWA